MQTLVRLPPAWLCPLLTLLSVEVADSPFHQLGLGVAVFLEAALGLERERMEDAARVLNEAVTSTAAAKKAATGGGGSWLGGSSAKGQLFTAGRCFVLLTFHFRS